MSQDHKRARASRALPVLVGGLAFVYAVLALAPDAFGGALAANGSGGRELVLDVNGDNGQVNVSVIQGQFTIVDPSGKQTQVGGGTLAQLPNGKTGSFDVSKYDGSPVGGIPLRDALVDDSQPEPFEVYPSMFLGDRLGGDWVLEDPKYDKETSTIVKTPDPNTLTLTVPDGNEFWKGRIDAPRILHQASGDFDLRGEIQIATKATDYATTQFIIKAPGSRIGSFTDQMTPEGDSADYWLPGGALVRAVGKYKISCLRGVTFPWTKCPDAPNGFVSYMLSRRGHTFSSYWSLDGQHWNLDSRNTLQTGPTLWVGWMVQRSANDGMPNEPAVVTFKNILLTTAPPDRMPAPSWNFDQMDGTATEQEAEVTLSLDGTKMGLVQAWHTDPIEGDMDVVVSFETESWQAGAGQRPAFTIYITNADETKSVAFQAAQEGATTPSYWTGINLRWQKATDAPPASGLLRVIREGESFSIYLARQGVWEQIDAFKGEGFSDLAYIKVTVDNLQGDKPAPVSAQFTILQDLRGSEAQGASVTDIPPAPSGSSQPSPASCPRAPLPAATAPGFPIGLTMAEAVQGTAVDPVNPTVTFNPSSIIHAVVQITNAPANTHFEVEWFVLDAGDTAPCNSSIHSGALDTSGTRNLDFSLTPSTQWLPGTYRVQILVNGKIAVVQDYSVS